MTSNPQKYILTWDTKNSEPLLQWQEYFYKLVMLKLFVLFLLSSFLPISVSAATDCNQVTEIPQEECYELLELYDSTDGTNWSDSPTNNWNITNMPCSWEGIECSNGHIFEIIIVQKNLTGSIPNFKSLNYLKKLKIIGNKLNGIIPNFTSLPRLQHVDLSQNQLSGPIPNFTGLPKLQGIVLQSNQLTGSIPNFDSMPDLRDIRVDFNQLTGTIPDFNYVPKLVSINLEHNQLTGAIPNFSNIPRLLRLIIGYNQLTVTIPDFTNINLLRSLSLSNNSISGSIPDFSNIEYLDSFTANNNRLSGAIPNFSNLSQLKRLYLVNNELSGSIPNFDGLPNLTRLRLEKNQLSGSIPNFNALLNLGYFYAYENQLTGSIPDFSALTKLKAINLSNNELSGSIPNFKTLANLWSLRLTNNQLTGPMPDFGNFIKLGAISVDNNQLCGEIPSSLSTLPVLSYLDIEYNHLMTSDPELAEFINKKDPDWEKTQTPKACSSQCLVYGLHDDGLNNSQFFTINPNNGFEVKALGTTHVEYDVEGMDIHPQSKELYASSGDNQGNGLEHGYIYQVNKSNGELTPVCSTGLGEVSAMSFHPQDNILWVWADGEGLFTVNLAQIESGICERTEILISGSKVEGMTWDNDGSIIYGASGTILYKYENNEVVKMCNDFPSQVEALDMLSDGSLLFSLHKSSDTKIHSFDIASCSIKDSVPLPIDTQYTDIEGITWICP